MVNTRSKIRDKHTLESTKMSDNEKETSFADVLTREQMIEFDSHDILNRQNNTETNVIDRRFNEMNRQIGELTDLVLALIKQIPSNPREGNVLNTVTTNANSRSDMVTGVPNSQPTGSRTTPPNGTPRSDDACAPQLTDVMIVIHHQRNSMGDTTKIFSNSSPVVHRGQRKVQRV